MHILQKKILDLSRTVDLGKMTLREVGQLVGELHPQNVKHHIEQLKKRGFLKSSRDGHSLFPADKAIDTNMFYSIPILGSASCGPALSLADEKIDGYLQISKSVIPNFNQTITFAVKASGNSMNNASIGNSGLSLEEGDYAVIEKYLGNADDFDNKYVLSIIDGMANIKKFELDKVNRRIVLRSESKQDYAPIVIQDQDFESYMVNGVVKTVIKA